MQRRQSDQRRYRFTAEHAQTAISVSVTAMRTLGFASWS